MNTVRLDHDETCRDCRKTIPAGAQCVATTFGVGASVERPRIVCLECMSR